MSRLAKMNKHSEMTVFRSDRTGRFADWRLALKSILGFWLFYALTVVARAFMGSDPGTVLRNKAVTIVTGIILTAAIYVVDQLFAHRASIRRQAVVAAIGSFIAAGSIAGVLIAADRYQEKPQDEQSYVSREGYRVVELGNTMRIERDGQSPLTVTWPHISALNPYLQFRIAADSAVVWLFFFAAWSAFYIAMWPRPKRGAERRAAEAESAARPPRSARCAIRSTRTSCSIH